MTREEVISLIKSAQLMLVNPKTNEPVSDLYEALDMAIKALEQEPKVGHWIEKEHYFEKCWAECSVCKKTASGHSKDTGWGFEYSYTDYCPNCGARMESEAAE